MATVTIAPPSINVSPPHNSSSQSLSGSSCIVVPQYPYNVLMPSFAGALLPYERSPMPDDNDVQTRLPSRCVDYLSHNWDESDVWTSWKAMTRHKNEMANGVRLENASWRTWAKQRNNLKTISPETLNWLKDSDVTWLYGPLHTAVDPVPPPKLSSIEDRFNLDGQSQLVPSQPTSSLNSRPGSSSSVRSTKAPGKSILKHRSLSEILGVGLSRGPESASDEGSEDDKMHREYPKRHHVVIAHTTSDPALLKLCNGNVGSDSIPVVTNGYDSSDLTNSGDDSDAARQDYSKRPPILGSGPSAVDDVKPKKHISFSHRVEQCIALDSEEERSAYVTKAPLRPPTRINGSVSSHSFEDEDDEEDDDDDLLTFRSSAPRQPGLHAVSHRYISPSTAGTMIDPYGQAIGSSTVLVGSSVNEPFTIARMAPTTLKSSEVLPAPSPVVVYDRDPPSNSMNSKSSYARPTYTVTATPSGSTLIDYSSLISSPEGNSKVPPVFSHQPSCSYSSCTYGPVAVSEVFTPPVTSPSSDILSSAPTQYGSSNSLNHWNVVTPDDEDTEEFTAMGFDYFCGPDLGLGDEYQTSRIPSQHLVSIQESFNSNQLNRKSPNNEDSTLIRTVPKEYTMDLTTGSPARSVVKLGGQEPILVPQVKSNKSCASLASSPLLARNDFSSSLILPTNDTAMHHVGTSNAVPISNCQDHPDRLSRGRSFSRGSSCSSFERISSDRRPSSSSPTQRPSSSPVTSNPVNSSTTSVNRRLGGSFRANSYDGAWSISKPSFIYAPIDEEMDGEGSSAAVTTNNSSNSRAKAVNRPFSWALGSTSSPASSESCSPSASKLSSSLSCSTRTVKGVNAASLHRPCLISEPKLASAKLDGSNVAPQSTDLDKSLPRSGPNSCGAGSLHVPSEDASSTTPTLFSLLSRQGNNSHASWWSDERTSNRLHAASGVASRPSLRSHNSDSSASTFIGRGPFSQNERKYSAVNRGSDSVDELRCSPEDEFGFGNYYGERSPEDDDLPRDEAENSGLIGRAADIVETAKVLVGALWSVGTRSIWGGAGPDNSSGYKNETTDNNSRVYSRRASTGGLPNQSQDEQVSYQHSVVIRPQCSPDAI